METMTVLLSETAAAAYVGLCPSTLNKARHAGKPLVPVVEVGRHARYAVEDLDQYRSSLAGEHQALPGEVWTVLAEFPLYGIGVSPTGLRVARLARARGTRPGKLMRRVVGRDAFVFRVDGKQRVVATSTLLRMMEAQINEMQAQTAS